MANAAWREDILAQLDFSASGVPPECLHPPPDEGGRVHRLFIAAGAGDLDTVRILFEGLQSLPTAARDYWTEPPTKLGNALGAATRARRRDVIEFLLENGVRPSTEHATYATQQRDLDLLALFLRYGWDINETDSCNPPVLVDAVQDDELRTFLLSHGADPNALGIRDTTALTQAVHHAPFPIIELLFDHGASAEVGFPLHAAVWRALPDSSEVIEYLLHKGAKINEILYEDSKWYGADILLGLGTPLHDAARMGKLDIARLLVSHGAHPLIEDSMGGTPLQVAKKAKQAAVAEYLYPITAAASPPEYQYTQGRRTGPWRDFYAPKPDPRL